MNEKTVYFLKTYFFISIVFAGMIATPSLAETPGTQEDASAGIHMSQSFVPINLIKVYTAATANKNYECPEITMLDSTSTQCSILNDWSDFDFSRKPPEENDSSDKPSDWDPDDIKQPIGGGSGSN